MSKDLKARVGMLSDREAVRVLESYASCLFGNARTSAMEMIDGIPAEVGDEVPFERALEMSRNDRARPLPTEDSVRLSRELLGYFARDPVFAPSLSATLDGYRDDELLASAVLATGVAVSMIIVAATTRFEAEVGGAKIVKDKTDAAPLESILKLFPGFKSQA